MDEVGVPASYSRSHFHGRHSLGSVTEMVAMVVSGTVSNVVGMIGTEARLRVQTAAMKVQWCVSPIDVLPTGCQPFPFIVFSLLVSISTIGLMRLSSQRSTYLLGVQYLVSLSDCLTGYSFPLYNTVVAKNYPRVQPSLCVQGPLDPMTLLETKPARTGLKTVRAMLNAGPHILSPSLLPLFHRLRPLLGDVLGALQTLARSTGCLTAHVTRSFPRQGRTPTSLGSANPGQIATRFILRYASPSQLRDSHSVWWEVAEAAPHHSHGTLARNLGCLRTVAAAALFLAGTLGTS